MTLYDTARCYSMICILGTWHMMHCMVAGIEAIIELSSVTVDCRLLDTIIMSATRSHGPIRFAGNDVSMNLIGPCDLAG